MKILVVDDRPELLELSERALLRITPAIHVLFAHSLGTAIDMAANNVDIDLVLLDLGLPDCTGVDALRRFRETFKSLRVAVFSGEDAISEALDLGAVAYIRKPIDTDVLECAIRHILAGGVYVSGISKRCPEPHASTSVLPLNNQEHRVAQLWVSGASIHDIARELQTSPLIIKKLVSQLLRYLQASRRSDAMIEISRRGLTFGTAR